MAVVGAVDWLVGGRCWLLVDCWLADVGCWVLIGGWWRLLVGYRWLLVDVVGHKPSVFKSNRLLLERRSKGHTSLSSARAKDQSANVRSPTLMVYVKTTFNHFNSINMH